jgi:hypothetical protein
MKTPTGTDPAGVFLLEASHQLLLADAPVIIAVVAEGALRVHALLA